MAWEKILSLVLALAAHTVHAYPADKNPIDKTNEEFTFFSDIMENKELLNAFVPKSKDLLNLAGLEESKIFPDYSALTEEDKNLYLKAIESVEKRGREIISKLKPSTMRIETTDTTLTTTTASQATTGSTSTTAKTTTTPSTTTTTTTPAATATTATTATTTTTTKTSTTSPEVTEAETSTEPTESTVTNIDSTTESGHDCSSSASAIRTFATATTALSIKFLLVAIAALSI